MFILDGGRRFVIPRTELTYPSHNLRIHENASRAPVDHVMADFEDACPHVFLSEAKNLPPANLLLNLLDPSVALATSG